MPGTYNNDNLYMVGSSAFFDYATASESIELAVGTIAVTLAATTKCWIKVGDPGESPTAAKPSAEKTWVQRTVPLNAGSEIDIAVPESTDAAPVKIAVSADAAAGVLDITARRE